MTGGRNGPREDVDPADPPGDGSEGARSRPAPPERIRSVLAAYHEAFDRGEIRELTPHVHRPCTVVTGRGAYILADRGEIESAFTSVRRDLRARGWERTERRDVRVRLLDDRLARARDLAVRFGGDEEEMERTGTTYVLRRTGRGWRIAVLVEHAPGEEPEQA